MKHRIALAAAAIALLAPGSAAADPLATAKPTAAPRHVPAQLQRLTRHRAVGRPLARAAYYDASRSVDSLAYCTTSGGLQQLGPGGSISTGASEFTASTSQPYAVRPTVTGGQWVAFMITVQRSDGASGSSHWYWGYANYPDGLFSTFSDGALWRFQDMATGERRIYVTAWDKPPAGLGDRFTMNVAWYLNGSWTKTLQVAVPWQNGDSGNLWCRQPG